MFRLFPLITALSILLSGCASPLGPAPAQALPSEAPVPPSTVPPVVPLPTSAPQPPDTAVTEDATVLRLLASLKEEGAAFDLEGASQAEFLRPAPGATYVGPFGRLYLHSFNDSQAAARRASQIPAELIDRGAVIDWVADPHFYLCGPVIALYLGQDSVTQETLTDLCGPEFAPANP